MARAQRRSLNAPRDTSVPHICLMERAALRAQDRGMTRSALTLSCALALLAACSRKPEVNQERQSSRIVPAEGHGQRTEPQVGARAEGPVETAPPNVPENKPAFAGQTRAPAMHTATPIKVSEVAEDFDEPWALEFLPDGRMLVTEKRDGELFVVTPDGKKSPKGAGVPRVDGGDQGGLLDITLGPDYATSRLVYFSYYEPRDGGNGLAVARGRLADGQKPKLELVSV